MPRAVRRLRRGVGDTMFLSADGKPWFRSTSSATTCRSLRSPPDLQRAVVAVEDRRFFLHPGIDPIGVAARSCAICEPEQRSRAAARSRSSWRARCFCPTRRTYAPKGEGSRRSRCSWNRAVEAADPRAVLNRIYLSAGVYGVETMSEHLFRKPASAVTLPEAALIAGLIRAPSTLSPWSNYDGALQRSHVVLARMRDQRFITAEQEAAARGAPAFSRIGSRAKARAAGPRTICGSSSGMSSEATPAGLAGAHDVRAPAAGGRGARRVGRAQRLNRPDSRPRSSRSIR